MQIELYVCGDSEVDAIDTPLLWDYREDAIEYARDTGRAHVYTVVATVDFSTIEHSATVDED